MTDELFGCRHALRLYGQYSGYAEPIVYGVRTPRGYDRYITCTYHGIPRWVRVEGCAECPHHAEFKTVADL